ncbi:conserved hypothetical protein [Trichinella spiralis]|uniref:hypothetical protein n=1 Tax=Trichinella spiralis TaxID=6334 RepID=UPI0001EFDB00|nr:conserved hypothetical protein [Trichinella spiralis]
MRAVLRPSSSYWQRAGPSLTERKRRARTMNSSGGIGGGQLGHRQAASVRQNVGHLSRNWIANCTILRLQVGKGGRFSGLLPAREEPGVRWPPPFRVEPWLQDTTAAGARAALLRRHVRL